MMKHILLCIAALFFCICTASAQNAFPTEQELQKWEYVTWNFWGGHCERRFIKNGSSVALCDENFIEIFDCDRNEQNCQLIGYYRVQGDSVLIRRIELVAAGGGFKDTIRCDRTEGLVYDFAAKLDDTLSCKINYPFNDPEATTEFWSINKSTVTHEGTPREVLNMNYRPYTNFPDIITSMNWTEGIGSNVHPFYSIACIGDHCEQEQQVTRVWRNGVLIYLDTVLSFTFPCTGWVTSNSLLEEQYVRISPNPAQDFIQIDIRGETSEPFDVTLHNALGKQVAQFSKLQSGSRIMINQFAPGLYTLSIRQLNRRFHNRLIIH